MAELKPCPFCGGSVRFDKAYSYFRDSVIYCDDCDMVFTLDDCQASDDEICEAWNSRTENRWIPVEDALPEIKKDHESDCVLCYCDTGAYAFSTLQENFFGQIGFTCEKEDDYYHSIGKVIAWMYLPEPPEKE